MEAVQSQVRRLKEAVQCQVQRLKEAVCKFSIMIWVESLTLGNRVQVVVVVAEVALPLIIDWIVLDYKIDHK